jgi:hypothetical protein
MAINQNHPFEELNGVKCGIVERNASPERVAFLKSLLEVNGYEVVVAPTPPPKAAAPRPAPKAEEGTDLSAAAETAPEPPAPETFTIGVTDYTFNTVNAIFGRLLRTKDGHVVTRDYWNQVTEVAYDDRPYFGH